jgi:hypothetical protein
MQPLIGAEPYFFCLDTKETKNQDNKYASTRPAGSSRFFRCSVLRTFTAHKKLNRHSRLRWPALVVRADPL